MERTNAQAFGIPCGSYHFYRSNKDPVEQANDFIRKVGQVTQYYLINYCVS